MMQVHAETEKMIAGEQHRILAMPVQLFVMDGTILREYGG